MKLKFILQASGKATSLVKIILLTASGVLTTTNSSLGYEREIVAECLPTAVESEIYEISTRHLPHRFCAIDENNPRFQVNCWSGRQWLPSSIESATGNQDGVVDDKLTIIYIHGNFMERNNTLERIRIIDSYLKRKATENYRLLLLSWPSQKQGRPLRDASNNAESAEDQSLYVAWLLNQLRPQSRLSLLAFSFGARAATGGLHLDAAGTIPGLHRSHSDFEPRTTPYRLGLIAPAIDRCWMESHGRHAKALEQTSHFINMYNTHDPVLKRMQLLDRVNRPVAGGYAGFSARPGVKTLQYNCGPSIGRTHSERDYLGNCPHFQKMIDTLLWNDAQCLPVETHLIKETSDLVAAELNVDPE